MNENNIAQKSIKVDVGLLGGFKDAIIDHSRKTTEKTDQLIDWLKLEVFQIYLSVSLMLFYALVYRPQMLAAEQSIALKLAQQEAYEQQTYQVQEAILESDKAVISAQEAIDRAYKAMFSCEDALIDAHKYFDTHLGKRTDRGI